MDILIDASILIEAERGRLDLAAARSHAQLWADLASRGALIGPHDLWLGAVCLAHGLAIATANMREFERVPGLTVETWS